MSRDETERLQDVKDAISAIRGHLKQAEPMEEGADLLSDAILFQLVVIGEAVKHLGEVMREAESTIPWRSIAGLRDLIAHEYFHISNERVMEIVGRDLDPLEQAVDRLLTEAGES